VVPIAPVEPKDVLELAGRVRWPGRPPIAQALAVALGRAEDTAGESPEGNANTPKRWHLVPYQGIDGRVDEFDVIVATPDFLEDAGIVIPASAREVLDEHQHRGWSSVLVGACRHSMKRQTARASLIGVLAFEASSVVSDSPLAEPIVRSDQPKSFFLRRLLPGLVRQRWLAAAACASAVAGLWFSWLSVSADELAVVQRFGRQVALLSPGLHIRPWWFCEKVIRLQPRVARVVSVGSADAFSEDDRDLPITELMLTGDVWPRIEPATQSASLPEASAVRSLSQLVQVRAAVQYGIADPGEFLFAVQEPDRIVQAAAEAVLRSIIAGRSMSVCLGEQRGLIAEQARLLLQERLDGLGCGIEVDAFILNDVRPFEAGHDLQESDVQLQEMEIGLQTQAEGDRLRAEAHRRAMAIVAEAESDRDRRIQVARELLEQVQIHAAAYQLDPPATRVRLLIERIGRMPENLSMLRRMLSGTRADDVSQTQEGSSP